MKHVPIQRQHDRTYARPVRQEREPRTSGRALNMAHLPKEVTTGPIEDIETGQVLTVWRPPFGQGRTKKRLMNADMTVSQIVAAMRGLPPDFFQRGHVLVNGEHDIDRRYWSRTRIRSGASIALTYPLAGGRSDSSKAGIYSLIIGIATLMTGGLTIALGIPEFGIAAGSLTATALPHGVSLWGRGASA